MTLRGLLIPMADDPDLRGSVERNGMISDFSRGYAPRGLTGNWKRPEAVELVLLLAEPSTPEPRERYDPDPDGWFRKAVKTAERGEPFGSVDQHRPFQKRLEWLLEECGYALRDQRAV